MRKKGFTLVEIIAALGIFSIIGVVISSFFSQSIRLVLTSEARLEMNSIHKENTIQFSSIEYEVMDYEMINNSSGEILFQGRLVNDKDVLVKYLKISNENSFQILEVRTKGENVICENIISKDIYKVDSKMAKDKAVILTMSYKKGNVVSDYEYSIKEKGYEKKK